MQLHVFTLHLDSLTHFKGNQKHFNIKMCVSRHEKIGPTLLRVDKYFNSWMFRAFFAAYGSHC